MPITAPTAPAKHTDDKLAFGAASAATKRTHDDRVPNCTGPGSASSAAGR
jgi:hypothetical protein